MSNAAYDANKNYVHFYGNMAIKPHRKGLRSAAIVTSICLITLFFVTDSQSSVWVVKTVDSNNDVGVYTSIAINPLDAPGNKPHISYLDATNGDLKYAKWTGTKWDITTVDQKGEIGMWSSLALDSNDNPHISYYHYKNGSIGDLKYAKWTGTTWDKTTVDSTGDVGMHTSIALDLQDNPHVSYYDNTNKDLKYAKWNGTTWDKTTVDSTGDVGWEPSISVDSKGQPHISYYDVTNGVLKYAKLTGPTWVKTTADSTGDVGWDSSLALDSNDNPHISYYHHHNGSIGDLKYAKWTGTTWDKITVDSTGDVGMYTSIALDSYDNPHISYIDWTHKNLKYALWSTKAKKWLIETVDSGGDVGRHSSITLDSLSNPHISYRDYTYGDLKYAWRKTTLAIAHIDIWHTSISDLIINIGSGDWIKKLKIPEGENNEKTGEDDKHLELTVDLSDAKDQLPPSKKHPWFLEVYSAFSKERYRGDRGKIVNFSIIYKGEIYSSVDFPKLIHDFQRTTAHVPATTEEKAE